MTNVYKKTKRGSVIKVRERFETKPKQTITTTVSEIIDYPKHLTPGEIAQGLSDGRLLAGKFQSSRENLLEGYVSVTINDEDVHVLVQGRESLNRAIHDDEVVIQLFPREEWKPKSDIILDPTEIEEKFESFDLKSGLSKHLKPTGKVVAITKRIWRLYTGVLRLNRTIQTTRCLFIPSDRRVPIIRIETRQYETLKNQRLVCAIDSWPRTSRYPLGHYVKSLGIIGDMDTEKQVLLLEHDVPHLGFTDAVLNCLPTEGAQWQIPKEEINRRKDLRDLNICSVDPPGCTDIDDALHYRDLDNEFCEVGVHIADVSYFVQTGSALDKEAANRGTTVYLTDRRIDMIPDLLSSNLCSLKQHVDRLAFSAIWKIRKSNAEIVNEEFAKSIINSKASLTYDQAQAMIDNKQEKGPIPNSLRGLNNLAKMLKQRRLDRGALVLARPDEIRFVEVESETHEREGDLEIQHKKIVDTNSMVEEFMLLANIAVASKLLQVYPEQAVLRRHPKPSRANFDDLIESAKVKGFEIISEDGKSLSDSLNKARLGKNEYFNLMLRMIATRCMTPALYFCSGYIDSTTTSFTHFGLAADLYTHFTSPIRRYADLLVHRFLASAIGASNLATDLRNKIHIQSLCDQINYRHRMAQLASRASLRLHTVLYIKSKKSLVETGYVFFVRQNALQILVPSIAYEFTYFLQPSEAWKYDVSNRSQTYIAKNIVIKQFDKLKVHVVCTNKEDTRFSDKIQISIINPKIDEIQPEMDCTPTDGDAKEAGGQPSDVEMKLYEETAIKMLEETRDTMKMNQMKRRIRLDLSVNDPRRGRPVIVMPGDKLDAWITREPTIVGTGLLKTEKTLGIYAIRTGLLKTNSNSYWVDGHQKRYVSARGESIIGIVRMKASQHARVDINGADLATLSLLAFEGATKRNKPNLNVGDLIYAKVLSANRHTETELVCVNSNGKREALGPVGEKGGVLMQVAIDTARALLSPRCDFLEKLGEKFRYEVAVGLNGRVWLDASERSTLVNLTNEIRKFDQKYSS